MNQEQLDSEATHVVGALVVGTAFFEALFWYYNWSTHGAVTLFYLNKVFAWTATALVMLVLLIGPLCIIASGARRLLHTRKYLGLLGGVLGLVHAIITIFFLQSRFGWDHFMEDWLPFVLGLGAALVYLYLVLVSNRWSLRSFGPAVWWNVQRWGIRVAFLLTYLHILFAKEEFWRRWYTTHKPSPTIPLSLILFGVMSVILLIRLILLITHPRVTEPAKPTSNPNPIMPSPVPPNVP